MSHQLRPTPMFISDAPRESREFLMAASLDLGLHLKDYIRVHDEIFSFSLGKLIPLPFLFQPIDFTQHYRTLRFIEADLLNLSDQFPELSVEEPELLAVIRDYTGRLLKSVMLLQGICQKLYQKADGTASYARALYKNDLFIYEQSVKNYRSAGSHLNRLLTQG